MDDLVAAQEQLVAKRRELGLDEDGRQPLPPTIGQVLKEKFAAADHGATTIFQSKEACTRTCDDCGRILEPITWEAFGKTLYAPRLCPECVPKREAEEAARREREEQEKQCGLYRGAFPAELARNMVRTLDEFIPRAGAEKAMRRVREFVNGLPTPPHKGLLLHGQTGNGKSNLAILTTLAARAKLLTVAHIPGYDWFRSLGSLEPDERERRIDMACKADLVVLDDLGVRRPTPAQSEWLLSVVDAVYRRNTLLVATTNHKPDDLADALTPPPQSRDDVEFIAGERIVDRLTEMAVFVGNEATSFRKELARRRRQEREGTP